MDIFTQSSVNHMNRAYAKMAKKHNGKFIVESVIISQTKSKKLADERATKIFGRDPVAPIALLMVASSDNVGKTTHNIQLLQLKTSWHKAEKYIVHVAQLSNFQDMLNTIPIILQ